MSDSQPPTKLKGLTLGVVTVGLLFAAFVLPRFVQQTTAAEGTTSNRKNPSFATSTTSGAAPMPTATWSRSKPASTDEPEPVVAATPKPAPEPAAPVASGTPPEPKPDLAPFYSAIDEGDFDGAEKMMTDLGIDGDLRVALEVSLRTARRAEKVSRSAAKPAVAAVAPRAELVKINVPPPTEIRFGRASSRLPNNAAGVIATATDALQEIPQLGIELRGYADKTGDTEYNAILSNARVQSVKDALSQAGIDAARLQAVAFGEFDSPKDAPASNAAERRVELRFVQLR